MIALYALGGPIFAGLLLVAGAQRSAPELLLAVVVVMCFATLELLVRREPSHLDFIFPVAIAPTLCCGLAAHALGAAGHSYWAVLMAPLAWSAALFGDAVVLCAWLTATMTTAVLFLVEDGGFGLGAAVGTAVVQGLVALVVRGTALESRQSRAALEAALEAARVATRTKSQFLADMSHEIRTPMAGVMGMTELALQTRVTDEQREYLETIRASGNHLLGVVDNILDISRIEAHKLELEAVPLRIETVLAEALRTLAPKAHEKRLELCADLDPGLPALSTGDPLRLRQVVLNLLGNAIKFTAAGQVTLRAVPVEDGVSIEVIDTGVGIALDHQQHIFESFTQAEGSTSRRFGGSGLGLTISQELVRRMGGVIEVQSTPGKGSTFRFTARLPALPPPEGAPPLEAGAGSVLVVYGDDAMRDHLCRELERLGRAPIGTADGEAARTVLDGERAEGRPCRAAVVDAAFGVELCRRLRQAQPDLRTILLLGARPGGGVLDGADLPGMRLLSKPVLRPDLARALSSVDEEPAPAAAAVEPARPARRLEVLLAEDSPALARITTRVLERMGHTVHLVEDGKAAVRMVGERAFDVVLMDVQMPVLDGYQATREIRRQAPAGGRPIPIIALTASAMEGDDQSCLDAGMNGYLTKPLDVARLRALIDQLAAA